jgi:hypothetical protein
MGFKKAVMLGIHGVLGGVAIATGCFPLAVGLLFTSAISARKLNADAKAKEAAEELAENDSLIIDTVRDSRPDIIGGKITREFPVDEGRELPMFSKGVSETTFDPVTGKRRTKVRTGF